MEFRERITVVIPSRGREKYLIRSVLYWLSIGVRVRVCEDSASPSLILSEMSETSPSLEYQWSQDEPISQRLWESTMLVDTEFCIWSSDDEFVLPSALALCVRALDEESWVGCSGRSLGFWISGKAPLFRSVYKPTVVIEETIEDRLSQLLDNYSEPLLWNFYRTASLKLAAKAMNENDISLGSASELTHAAAIAIQGKIGTIDGTMRLRSGENINQWKPNSKKFPNTKSWWEGAVSERNSMLKTLSNLTLDFNGGKQIQESVVARSFQNYLNLDTPNQFEIFKSKVLFFITFLVHRTVGPALNRFRSKKYELTLSAQEKNELDKIRKVLLAFHRS